MTGSVDEPPKRGRDVDLLLVLTACKIAHDRFQPLRHLARRDSEFFENGRHDTRGLFDQRSQQVLGLQLGVVTLLGFTLRSGNRLLRLFGQFVHVHVWVPL